MPPSLHDFDMGVLSPAELKIKAFVNENNHILDSSQSTIDTPLGPDALMDIGNTLKLASSIIDAAMEMVLSVRQCELISGCPSRYQS